MKLSKKKNKPGPYRFRMNHPWKMDNWVFWILLVMMGGLLGAVIYLGVIYSQSIIK
jgi:hypothetical protein